MGLPQTEISLPILQLLNSCNSFSSPLFVRKTDERECFANNIRRSSYSILSVSHYVSCRDFSRVALKDTTRHP
jgi:hypothetical protein